MNYDAFTLAELGSLAITDRGARQHIADNAERFVKELTDQQDDGYDPAGCYDNGHNEGGKDKLKKLSKLYSEQLLEWLLKVPEMAIAGDGNLDELETLLAAIHAEFEDE